MSEKNKFNKDDQDWLNLLAGLEVEGVEKPTRTEAETLRKLFILDVKNKPDELKPKRALNALLQKLKDEKLIKKKKRYFNSFSLASVAASVVAVSVALSVVINVGFMNDELSDVEKLSMVSNKALENLLQQIPGSIQDKQRSSAPRSIKSAKISTSSRTLIKVRRTLYKFDVEYSILRERENWLLTFETKNISRDNLKYLAEQYNLKIHDDGRAEISISYD